MLFTYLYIDNFYNFSKTSIDFTLKRELKDSLIDGEYLEERPKFRFKRVCILSGANASGKTSLGHILLHIQHFILSPNIKLRKINHKEKVGSIKVEFVFPQTNTIHYLEIRESSKEEDLPSITYASIPILQNSTAYATRKRLKLYIEKKGAANIKGEFFTNEDNPDELYTFKSIRSLVSNDLFFYYMFSHNVDKNKVTVDNLSTDILEKVLQTFDSSITSVDEIITKGVLDGYSIHFSNKDTILIGKNGEMPNTDRLSKGTFDSIQVAEFVAYIIGTSNAQKYRDICTTYFLDEKMAYSHSELEQSIVNLIIQKMGRYSQFFYTTHNYDILDLNLPVHSYLFLRKDGDKAEFVQPEDVFSKNDRSLLNYVRNDIFNTVPDISLIDSLLFED
ncbi:ATP-binding protein [Psychrobacter sanguinis]|uniref:ATP-binding protein n=1 Tax=Psychrobacter sanguinis TaxID=861445 RepID=UPI0019182809|nr:ATP-binding protein [Psychrobacter sanguinis]MCC3344559.1 ATP-binding protein [Psychrobacter sanguinis]